MAIPPYGKSVITWLANHPNDVINIYAGTDSFKKAADDFYEGVKPSLCLPHPHDHREFFWPVNNIKIVLTWKDGTELDIANFANFLVYEAKALAVYTLLNNDVVKFTNLEKML